MNSHDNTPHKRGPFLIGVYDYTVIVTYMSLISAICGMTSAIHGKFKMAIFCLALSGLCDMFDGKIARTKKNRTDDEKNFGIQLDSLCDVVCFGACPALIAYLLGVRGLLGLPIVFLYCICGVIRLAYFNVLEGKRMAEEGGGTNKTYHGLPITSISVILPLIFMTQFFTTPFAFQVILRLTMLITGLLFIIDFKFPKPTNVQLIGIVSIVAIAVILIVAYSKFKVPKQNDFVGPMETEIMEDIDEMEEAAEEMSQSD